MHGLSMVAPPARAFAHERTPTTSQGAPAMSGAAAKAAPCESPSSASPAPPPSRPPAAAVRTRAQLGMASPPVTVETHVGSGLPRFTLVGLPETAVREARDRVRSAIENNHFRFPQGRVVVNLAPADLAKQGGRFDLAIAMSLLAATNQVATEHLHRFEFLAELSLYGALRHTRGVLPAALAMQHKDAILVVPEANRAEAELADSRTLVPCAHLSDVLDLVADPTKFKRPVRMPSPAAPQASVNPLTLVQGQHTAKRALQVAAAGGHHFLMVGPPGVGKTMLARSLVGLMPKLTEAQALEVAAVYSSAGLIREAYDRTPWRDPHHSATAPAIIGGGHSASPGEASLAHHGVLFLDEMPHFQPRVLNLLREPLETHQATITRANYRVNFPANFQLIAAMNPCPAGRVCQEGACRCQPRQVQAYQARVSGPLLDRIDMQLMLGNLPKELLAERDFQPTDAEGMAHAVAGCRRRQVRRQGLLNGRIAGPVAAKQAPITGAAQTLLTQAIDRFHLSARSYHKIIKVAWTIADLTQTDVIGPPEVAEALSYRAIDWESISSR